MNDDKKQTKPASTTDSLFGMALAQAFLGAAFGPGVYMAWEAAENCSAIYEDRKKAAPKSPLPQKFDLGVKNSLSGPFFRSIKNEEPFFMPSFMPAMTAPAPGRGLGIGR